MPFPLLVSDEKFNYCATKGLSDKYGNLSGWKGRGGFPGEPADLIHFARSGSLWPIKSTLADQVHLAQVNLAVRFRDQFW